MINFSFALFFHLAGIIIALGAVTVIDTMGFFSRNSKEKTQTTIKAHHITKPLIWLGTIILTVSWIPLFMNNSQNIVFQIKTAIIPLLVLNGIFLSFYISPKLDELIGKKALLPKNLKNKIAFSMTISFVLWWTFVVLTVLHL